MEIIIRYSDGNFIYQIWVELLSDCWENGPELLIHHVYVYYSDNT